MPKSARQAAAAPPEASAGPRVLKKYPNRRLYDTQASSYITLAEVKRMVLDAVPFEVRDAKSGEDLTRSILLQIILEEESGGLPIFSTPMLAQLIRFYGNAMQGLMGQWLEKNLQTFGDMQQRVVGSGAGLVDAAAFKPEAWAAWLQGQPPAMMPGLVGDYVNQSAAMMAQMQEQMTRQAAGFFGGMAALTPSAATAATASSAAGETEANAAPTVSAAAPRKSARARQGRV
jgi:polyhydroxyalkanoate synthesis repressor PhaR